MYVGGVGSSTGTTLSLAGEPSGSGGGGGACFAAAICCSDCRNDGAGAKRPVMVTVSDVSVHDISAISPLNNVRSSTVIVKHFN